MKLIAYSVHFFILIQSVFAPRTPWNQVDDAIFGGLENLSEWSDTFSHSEPHVARTPQSPSSSATLAFRPPGHPHEAHYAPGYPRTWDNVQPPAPQQWGNVQPPAPQQWGNVQPPAPQQWGNVQPPAPLQWGHVQPPAPQQRGNVQPPATNEFYPDPHWNHIYQPHTAPQQYATHAPAPLVPFDPSPIEHWPNVEDRNPDDLTAVVYGNKGKGPLLEVGGSSRGPLNVASWSQPEQASLLHAQPAQHEEYNSNRRQATAHNPAGLIPGSEPLALSGRPLIIKYGPDKGLFPLVDKIKGMLKISRANRRYPFSRSLSQDDMPNFYSSIYDYLSSSNRLFKEIIFENRRYLISFIRPNNELKLKQLAYSTTIWEFKAEGAYAAMHCRGIFVVNHNNWIYVDGAEWTDSYIVHSHKGYRGTFALEIKKGDRKDIYTREVWQLRTKKRLIVHTHTVAATTFTYRRQDNFQPMFQEWLANKLSETKWVLESYPEIRLDDWAIQNFSNQMSMPFSKRKAIYGININQQPFLITHHPPMANLYGGEFIAFWEPKNNDMEGPLVALGLYPLKRSQFDTLKKRSNATPSPSPWPHRARHGRRRPAPMRRDLTSKPIHGRSAKTQVECLVRFEIGDGRDT